MEMETNNPVRPSMPEVVEMFGRAVEAQDRANSLRDQLHRTSAEHAKASEQAKNAWNAFTEVLARESASRSEEIQNSVLVHAMDHLVGDKPASRILGLQDAVNAQEYGHFDRGKN